jgi:methylated-DNA-[protein]-cysteine S-methyltransferase
MDLMRWTVIDSPIGELSLAVDEVGLRGVRFGPVGSEHRSGPLLNGPVLAAAREQLGAYFAGELTEFTVPLSVPGGSAFEQAVWAQLSRIPYGEMQTYGEVAKSVGDQGAARAVGVACNRNPIPVIVPCHRVVGAGGKMVGFGGGLPRKRHLLELEARVTLETAWS